MTRLLNSLLEHLSSLFPSTSTLLRVPKSWHHFSPTTFTHRPWTHQHGVFEQHTLRPFPTCPPKHDLLPRFQGLLTLHTLRYILHFPRTAIHKPTRTTHRHFPLLTNRHLRPHRRNRRPKVNSPRIGYQQTLLLPHLVALGLPDCLLATIRLRKLRSCKGAG